MKRTTLNHSSNLRRVGGIAALAVTMSVGLAACSDDGDTASDDSSSDSSADTSESADATPSEDTSSDAGTEDATFGAACGQIPATGPGSLNGMTTDPVATAASNNPLLSTLVTAVGAVPGLADQLNSAEELTVFAPYNDAFAAIDPAALEGLLADPDALGAILSHHVLPERLEPDEIAGTHTTLNGDEITVEGDASAGVTVENGEMPATVLCGGVQTANATVYVIDSVLMPAA